MTTGNKPLVSVICLCYNHGRFVKEAIESVLNQAYANIELIVVDDKSSDNSVAVIKEALKDHPEITFIEHSENKGNCKSFNEGWRAAGGDFFIDLAADDVLPKNRIEIGVREFVLRDETWGVQYGEANFINEEGTPIGRHESDHPEGDIYIDLVRRYFVSSASLMIRRNVLEKLNGFDEMLAYEDFDFLIRSSRHFKYFYTPEVLINKRIVKGSMSEKQFQKGNPQQLTTYRVCEKILALNKTVAENKALSKRISYEIRQSLKRLDLKLLLKYLKLSSKVSSAAYR